MLIFCFLLFQALNSSKPAPAAGPATSPPSQQPVNSQDQQQALLGNYYLHLGRLSDAQANCDAALKLNPANKDARRCLHSAAIMAVDQDLNTADAKLADGDSQGAAQFASRWARAPVLDRQRVRAWVILTKARPNELVDTWNSLTPDWLRQALDTIVIVTALWLLLLFARWSWSEWRRTHWLGSKITWRALPFKEVPAAADAQTGIPTDVVFDALGRLGHELKQKLWEPKLLLLRPTPPANYEPAIIDGFLSDHFDPIVLAPPTDDLSIEWKSHEIQPLDQAVQTLQFKAGSGIDIGSVARFLRGVLLWFNAGAPTISGVAETGTDAADKATALAGKTVSIHLAASGGPVKSTTVRASTTIAPGIDAVQLSAERAAFKFLFRMRHPELTTDQIDGFSALRQGVTQFAQFAGTVPGAGQNVATRTSSLAKAALNLNFFRASIPIHCALRCDSTEGSSLHVTDEIRQAALLAEGVAYALIGSAEKTLSCTTAIPGQDRNQHQVTATQNWMSAVDCFRQLQDWPASPKTELLRQQAIYNEAIVWRQAGQAGRCVLMLTQLLGQRTPDTVMEGPYSQQPCPKASLPDSIWFPAQLARLDGLAQYTRDDWTILPSSRAELVIHDAQKLVNFLQYHVERTELSPHDLRIVDYMYIQSLRSLGHVELLRVITGAAKTLYNSDDRPLGLKDRALEPKGADALNQAVSLMLTCERLAPSCELYCDLAEAYLLLKDFTTAEGYARHARLESGGQLERAYYIAAESLLMQNTEVSCAQAKKYAGDFKSPTLNEFKALCEELHIPPHSAPPESPETPQLGTSSKQAAAVASTHA